MRSKCPVKKRKVAERLFLIFSRRGATGDRRRSIPDGDSVSYRWFFYKEASHYPGALFIKEPTSATQTVIIPKDIGKKSIHVVLEVVDKGSPELVSYRRVILSAE